MSFPNLRLRRLRKSGKIRELLEEVRLSPKDLICPIFVQEDLKARVQGESMPGFDRLPLKDVVDEVNSIVDLKIPAPGPFAGVYMNQGGRRTFQSVA